MNAKSQQELLNRYLRFLAGNRIAATLVLLLLFLPALFCATNISKDSSTERFIVKDDPNKEAYDRFLKDFGNDEAMVVLIPETFPAGFSFEPYRKLLKDFQGIPMVTKTYSPFDKYGTLINKGEKGLGILKEKVAGNPFEKKGSLISFDSVQGHIAFILFVKIEKPGDRTELYHTVRKLIADEGFNPDSALIAGEPVLNHYLGTAPEESMKVFLPILFVLSALFLYFFFRNLKCVLISFSIIGVTELLTFGIVGLTEGILDILSSILPVVLYIVTLAASIHILHPCAQLHFKDKESYEADILAIFAEKFKPCLFSAATTAAGFGSFFTSSVDPVKYLGLYLSWGVGVSFFVLYTLLPLLCLFFGFLDTKAEKESHAKLLSMLERFSVRFPKAIIGFSFIMMIVAGIAGTTVPFQTNGLLYFKEDSYVRQTTSHLEAMGFGLSRYEIVFEGKGVKEEPHSFLEQLAELEENIRNVNGVQKTLSAADIYTEVNGLYYFGYFLPSEDSLEAMGKRIAQEDPTILPSFWQPEQGKARLSIQIRTIGNDEFERIKSGIEGLLAASPLSTSCTIVRTGQFPLIMDIQEYLVTTLQQSFFMSFSIVLICFYLLFRSVRLSLIALPPNLFPIFASLLCVWLLGYSFDVGTIMIASIVLGIVVDSTAHFIHRYRKSLPKGGNGNEAIETAMKVTGSAILISGLILAFGFLVFVFSDFLPIQHFGVLASVAVFAGLVGDLVILPALLSLMNKTTSHPRIDTDKH